MPKWHNLLTSTHKAPLYNAQFQNRNNHYKFETLFRKA